MSFVRFCTLESTGIMCLTTVTIFSTDSVHVYYALAGTTSSHVATSGKVVYLSNYDLFAAVRRHWWYFLWVRHV